MSSLEKEELQKKEERIIFHLKVWWFRNDKGKLIGSYTTRVGAEKGYDDYREEQDEIEFDLEQCNCDITAPGIACIYCLEQNGIVK